MWQPITTAPFDRELELAVIEREDIHALIFPCRREPQGWINVTTGKRVVINPTHWRAWDECHELQTRPH